MDKPICSGGVSAKLKISTILEMSVLQFFGIILHSYEVKMSLCMDVEVKWLC